MEPNKKRASWVAILLTIVIPATILMRFSGEDALGPLNGLLVALAFPVGFGVFELWTRRVFDFLAVVGFIGVLLTGGIGLLQLDPKWLAVKEALIPGFIGLVLLISKAMGRPVLNKLLEQGMDLDLVLQRAAMTGSESRVKKIIANTNYLVVSSFALSAFLNYFLAKKIVVSEPGTEAFNVELGRLTLLSYPVIVVPSLLVVGFATYYLIRGTTKNTGLSIEDILAK